MVKSTKQDAQTNAMHAMNPIFLFLWKLGCYRIGYKTSPKPRKIEEEQQIFLDFRILKQEQKKQATTQNMFRF